MSSRFPFGFFERGETSACRRPGLGLSLRFTMCPRNFTCCRFCPGRLESRRAGHGESLFAIRKHQDGESAEARGLEVHRQDRGVDGQGIRARRGKHFLPASGYHRGQARGG